MLQDPGTPLGRVLFLTAALVLTPFVMAPGAASAAAAEPRSEASAEILAALLSHADLQGYFHRDSQPERFPLQIIDAARAGLTAPDPAKTLVPAVLPGSAAAADPRRARLFIDGFRLDAEAAEVTFRFPAEGLSGSAALTPLGGAWQVRQLRLTEE